MEDSLLDKLRGKHRSSIKVPESSAKTKTINEIKPKPFRDIDDPLPFQPKIKLAPKPQISEFVPYIKAKEKLKNAAKIASNEIKVHHYQSSGNRVSSVKKDNQDDNKKQKREFNYWGNR